mmetsp:Transcript_19110/g.31310  ORF Transcript_19110/g.31310 Transcript_19110/m.31310 type:complete len:196 (+) Transcript_19110:227-814(+)
MNGFHLHDSYVVSRPFGLKDVQAEHTKTECEVVDGVVPEWILGSVYRQSGGAFLGEDKHAFLDGLAHINSYKFTGDGRVLFSNKFMRTKQFKTFADTGKRTWGGTVENGKELTVFQKLVTFFSTSTVDSRYDGVNPNVTTWLISDPEESVRLAAVTEATGEVCEFDPETLDTIKTVPMLPNQPGMVVTNAAHWFF